MVRAFLVFLCFSIGVSHTARAGTVEYKAEFYSYDGPLRGATASHTFARFLKIVDGSVAEIADISWLPTPGNFRRGNRVPLLRTTPGHNYSVEETMAIAGGRPVLNHGSFFITPDLYQAAVQQKARLDSGAIAYKMLDGRSGDGALNCIHAVTGVVARLNTGLARGETATNAVVNFFLRTGKMSAYPFDFQTPLPVSPPPPVAQAPGPVPPTHDGGIPGPPENGRPYAPPRFYSADTTTRFYPISDNTVAINGSPVPPGAVRPLGWRFGLNNEIIWVFRDVSEFPDSSRVTAFFPK